jgi:apolipoprotein D and lipocalin family protein
MKKIYIGLIYLNLALMSFFNCSPQKAPLQVAEQVELEKYTGKWYEIARLPNSFEKGLECCTAEYTLLSNGKIEVLNTGYVISDRSLKKTARGKAYVPDNAEPGKLKVSFFGPFYAKYWILYLDSAYQYVLVGEPSRKYLWILARNTTIDEADYQMLVEIAKNSGFDTSRIIRVKQDCGN